MQSENELQDFNRRDFLKGGSFAALMTMLGGVPLFAEGSSSAPTEEKEVAKTKVAVIGLGAWGREILNTLARLKSAQVAAVCDNYPAFLKRGTAAAPGSTAVDDYKKILDDKEIPAVIIATPTHTHKEIAVAALKAGKHVYCEAPLANTIEDARAIAKAAKAAPEQVFQSGLQLRSDPQRHFLLPFIRSGAIGEPLMARAQWHKKYSWRATASTPEREKAMNWRLDKKISTGLVGELGCHQLDQADWYLAARPVAVSGFGSVQFWKDGREVADTVQFVFEYASGASLSYDATLANSFDATYEMLYGSDAAVMMRESKAWLFKEVDSPLLGWEVYARKENFYKETGIALVAGASKSVQGAQTEALPFTNTPLSFALDNFLRNASDITIAVKNVKEMFGDDKKALLDELAKVPRQPAASYMDGFYATVACIKANEAQTSGKRVEIKQDVYELG